MSSASVPVGPQEAVRLVERPPDTRLTIQTRRTDYTVVVIAPVWGELLLQGGERFPEPVAALLKGGEEIVVRRRQVTLRCQKRRVTTSTVRSIQVHPTTG